MDIDMQVERLVESAKRSLLRHDLKGARKKFFRVFQLRCRMSTFSLGNLSGPPLAFPIHSVSKFRHDVEQMDYLVRSRKLGPKYRAYVERGRHFLRGLPRERIPGKPVFVFPEVRKRLSPFFGKPFSIYRPGKLKAPVVNLRQDVKLLEREYKRSGMVVLDEVLSARSLEQLQRFCLESAIWHDEKVWSYVGSQIDSGFCCELLFRIASELRQRLPGILGDVPLSWMWAYRYPDRRFRIGPHVDPGRFNANLWITPDGANLNPGTGGMVVYRTRAPRRWSREDNGNHAKIREILERNGDEGTRIPYRCNRMVLFDSSRFHESDSFRFSSGFENHRTSVTWIYGMD